MVTAIHKLAFVLPVLIVLIACDTLDSTSRKIQRVNAALEERKSENTRRHIRCKPNNTKVWRILVVHSYLDDYRWVQEINAGIRDRFAGKDYLGRKDPCRTISCEIKYFYMNTKHNTSVAWMQRQGAEAAELVKDWRPDLVIAADDNAQEFFTRKFTDSPIPFVFCGVNKSPKSYGYIESLQKPGHNVTGVIERVNFSKTLHLVKQLVPGSRTVFLLGDNSPTNQGLMASLLPLLEKSPLKIAGSKLTDDFEEWKNTVKQLPLTADVVIYPHYHTLKNAAGEPISSEKVLEWTLRNSAIPDVTFWNFGVVDGILCSIAVWGKSHGYEAADIACRILERQEDPGSISIRAPLVGTIILNRERAKMLDIQIPFPLLADAVLVNVIGVFRKGIIE